MGKSKNLPIYIALGVLASVSLCCCNCFGLNLLLGDDADTDTALIAVTTTTSTATTVESTTTITTAATTTVTTEPPQTEPPTNAPVEVVTHDYVLNTNTKKFHYPTCSSAKDIKASNRSDYNGSRDDVINQGYKPCGRCHP